MISGDFSGWNYGIEYGGWFGLAIAFVLMGLMYVCTVLGEAELSSVLPTAGAGFAFSRCALGRFGGFVTGLAISVEYICAPAAISTFIANYFLALGLLPEDFPTIAVVAVVFIAFIAIHILGVGEALKLMLVVTLVGVVALLTFAIGVVPSFDPSNLFDIAPDAGGTALLPHGFAGLMAALPFGIWFFLGIEGVPLAAEEAKDPRIDIPRANIGAMLVLIFSGLLVLIFAAGVTGASVMVGSSRRCFEFGWKRVVCFVCKRSWLVWSCCFVLFPDLCGVKRSICSISCWISAHISLSDWRKENAGNGTFASGRHWLLAGSPHPGR